MTKQKSRYLAGMLMGAVAGLVLLPGAWAGDLRAGAARVSITPPSDILPYKAERERPFVGVHDELFARALVLDDGATRVAIVVVEDIKVPTPDTLLRAVAEAAGVPVANVMLAATHTHSTPLTFFHSPQPSPAEQREIDRVSNGAVQATRDAVAALRPARIAFGRGEAFVNVNNGEERDVKGWYDPYGSSDKSLDLVRVTANSGEPLALLVNYANHAEVMFRSVSKQDGYEITGDLPGAVSHILEGQAKAAPVVLFTAAAEGDQLPLLKSLQPEADLPGTDQGAAGWAVLDLMARRLSVAALRTLATLPEPQATARIGVASGSASCPGQRYQRDPAGGAPTRIDTAPVVIPLSVIRVGGLTLAGVGADVASDIGRRIKATVPGGQTTLVTMTAGAIGYVLNDASYSRPSHGVMGSPIKPGCAPAALADGLATLAKAAGG